tara:strand:+ start:1337 stop:2584 length:1248 start_codon:yes stop_codon:yes gene_type:complete
MPDYNIQSIKQRFGIIGNSNLLNRALDVAIQVAPTDLSVLITGESGVGKERMPQIIHQLSARKHNKYIAVNCGAIPDGTIDSELFGHEKGSFTGAQAMRKGYFEEADGGTIFLDEVGELPLQTQVRLLRVLETGEFIKVGTSKVQKTNVRIVAATNEDVPVAISKGKFREDLFYRLNSVPIKMPSLRERKEDIHLLFRKFASDFSEKYRMPVIRLTPDATLILEAYGWKGNIRQLKNLAEQISVIESTRIITREVLLNYLPDHGDTKLPAVYKKPEDTDFSERDILYKFLFDMKKDLGDLKKVVFELVDGGGSINKPENKDIIDRIYNEVEKPSPAFNPLQLNPHQSNSDYQINRADEIEHHEEVVEENLSIEEKEKELIKKALEKYHGRRKGAAKELGISERTLYRKIKEYNLN